MSAEAGGTESLGVVFLHHRTDEVTANNLASFRDWNPHATIVTMGAEESFPGGYSIRDFPRFAEHWHHQISKPGMRGQSPDLLLYAWYQNRREHCDRWLVVEWDSFCAMKSDGRSDLYRRDALDRKARASKKESDQRSLDNLRKTAGKKCSKAARSAHGSLAE